MKHSRYSIFVVLFSVLLLPTFSHSLQRDYMYDGAHLEDDDRSPNREDEFGDPIYYYNSSELCFRCFSDASLMYPYGHESEIDISGIPATKKNGYGDDNCICYSHFIEYSADQQSFLNNAWVKPKI